MWKSIIKNLKQKNQEAGTPGTPWSVSNVKSNRTDSMDDNGNFTTAIGNEITGDAGHTYQVDSTAVQSARFEPSDNSLNIQFRNGNGKEYKFQADENDAKDFLNAPSKGRFIGEWVRNQSHRYPGY
jgi:hypothetical protein